MLRGWYTVFYQPEKQPKWDEIKKGLTARDDPKKQAAALEQLVLLSYSESIPPHLLMPVIQYTGTTKDHRVIKLLLLFLENVEVRDARGEIRPEFILITDAIRNLILSHNEYIRIAVMRFLYKLNDIDINQQLLSPVLENLSHPDENVRWCASRLVGRMARDLKGFDQDVEDQIIEAYQKESNQETIISMLLASYEAAPKEALKLAFDGSRQIQDLSSAILKIAPKTYKKFTQYRYKILETIVDLCDNDNPTIRLEAATVLKELSTNPGAVRTAATTYCDLLQILSDENQRGFVVQQIVELAESRPEVLGSLTLEMSQGATVGGQIRQRLLTALVNMVQKDSAVSLVPLIASKDKESLEALRKLLLKFPETATIISEQIGTFLSDSNSEVAEISARLLNECGIAGAAKEAFRYFNGVLETTTVPTILSTAMWAIAEFSEDPNDGASILCDLVSDSVVSEATTIVNEDGTYVQKTIIPATDGTVRKRLAEGDSFLGLALVAAVIKTKMRGANVPKLEDVIKISVGFKGAEKNALDLVNLWRRALERPHMANSFKIGSAESFAHRTRKSEPAPKKAEIIPANSPMQFSVLFNTVDEPPVPSNKNIKLPIIQLTGPSDSLYVEANATLRKYDRVYHFTLYNRTESTLTNILFEFTTVGAVSILQKNNLISLPPGGSQTFDVPVMISAGSCGTIFGDASFDFAGAGGSDHQLLPLAPIDIDPFFAFEPTNISDSSFRNKWSKGTWERKIDISTEETDLVGYLEGIAKTYKFAILTPREQLEVTSKSAGFVAANLYTRSVFGEEVEMNISAKISNGRIQGFLRIRSTDEKITYLFGELIQ